MSVHTTLTNNYELTNGVATYECRTSEYRYQELIAIEVDYNQCIIKTLTVIKKINFIFCIHFIILTTSVLIIYEQNIN